MDEITAAAEPLNRKNITGEILGFSDDVDFNLDDFPDDNGFEAVNKQSIDPTADNAIVNVLDLFITSSPAIFARYGYPSPDLTVWKEWAKPNLNVAFNHYVPVGAMVGGAVTMPIIAAFIGVAAIGVAFLPVILHHIDVKKREQEVVTSLPEPEEVVEPEPEPEKEPEAESTEHKPTVSERMSQIEEQVV